MRRSIRPSSPLFVGIAGGTASGKSTLAAQLVAASSSGYISILLVDSYYRAQDSLPLEQRKKVNYDHPDAFEFDLLTAHLASLADGQRVAVPVYDYTIHTRASQAQELQPAPVIIVEGILSLYPASVRAYCDLKLFVDAPSQLRLQRRLERDTRERGRTRESVLSQWETTVDPMHCLFCEPTRSFADQIIDGSGWDDRLIQNLLERIARVRDARL